MLNYKEICSYAIEDAKLYGIDLDFSAESIEKLDEILRSLYDSSAKNDMTEKRLYTISIEFGIYLGETLLKNCLAEHGYSWQLDENNIPVLAKGKDFQMSPVSKVYKRLTDGYGNEVKPFYNVAIAIAEGRFPKRNA